VADAAGNELQQALAAVAAATESGKFAYNRFFAVGLFRWALLPLLMLLLVLALTYLCMCISCMVTGAAPVAGESCSIACQQPGSAAWDCMCGYAWQ
jgi:hypothetical protein